MGASLAGCEWRDFFFSHKLNQTSSPLKYWKKLPFVLSSKRFFGKKKLLQKPYSPGTQRVKQGLSSHLRQKAMLPMVWPLVWSRSTRSEKNLEGLAGSSVETVESGGFLRKLEISTRYIFAHFGVNMCRYRGLESSIVWHVYCKVFCLGNRCCTIYKFMVIFIVKHDVFSTQHFKKQVGFPRWQEKSRNFWTWDFGRPSFQNGRERRRGDWWEWQLMVFPLIGPQQPHIMGI